MFPFKDCLDSLYETNRTEILLSFDQQHPKGTAVYFVIWQFSDGKTYDDGNLGIGVASGT